MKKLFLSLLPMTLIALALPAQTAMADDRPFPKRIATPSGSAPEGFAIGKGPTAYNGSVDGSIYKVDLRSGEGEILVPADSDSFDCRKLGMRVDDRSNYLFVAGCFYGNAYVFDANDGALVMEYQLGPPGLSIINDLAITRDAVYFTDSFRAVLYRLPLSANGALPGPAAIEEITLPDEFAIDPAVFCCGGNGIVATPDGTALIIGHSNLSRLYRVDTASGDVEAVSVDPPVAGFLDGLAMKGHALYIMTPTDPAPIDAIQVVRLDQDLRSGSLVQSITDPDDLDDVASGAFFGAALYVNNARYSVFPGPDAEYWITKLKLPAYPRD